MNMLIDDAKPTSEDQDVFLADVLADPVEFTNLAREPQYASVVRELSERLDNHTHGSVEVAPECLTR